MIASKLSAFIWHGFALTKSYRLNFVARYLSAFVTVVFYVFLAEMFRRANVAVSPGSDYFSFLLIGGAFSKYVEIGMRTLSHTLREEMLMGTVEPLLATATPTTLALIGPSLFIIAEGTLLVLAQLLMGAAFGADFSRANWPAAFIVTVTLILSLLCWGVIAAAFTLRYKRADPIGAVVGAITYLFSGVFVPVASLPPAMQVISYLLPFTYGLQALRGALLEGLGLAEVWPHLAALLLFVAALTPLALLSIRAATRHLKHSGALGHY
jgi:ABC-2 type transport system permease protein